MSYLDTTKEVYREAALTPQAGLCCTASKPYQLPGLSIPEAMLEMNYGCGTTLHLQDLRPDMTILYVGGGRRYGNAPVRLLYPQGRIRHRSGQRP